MLASTLLGVRPPELPTRSLVGTASLLGISPGTARVAISRMVAAGELEATATGYRLASPALLARQQRQAESAGGETVAWNGAWRVALVGADAEAGPRTASERAQLRGALTALRFAEWREGAWLRPDNLRAGVLPDAESVVASGCLLLTATPDGTDALAARLWPLDAWADDARDLLVDLDDLGVRIDAGDTAALAEGFVASAATLRHFQADPLLPADLLPADWPGPDLRARHAAFDRSFKATLAAWQREAAAGSADGS